MNGDTGEIVDPATMMNGSDKGVICGFELYRPICEIYHKLEGWKLFLPGRKNNDQRMLRLYYYRASHRIQGSGDRKRNTITKTWVIWNFELFHNNPDEDIIKAAVRLRKMLDERGVKPTATPGGMGKAMLKASPEFGSDRYFAPPWISEIAREHLPGNFYAIRDGFRKDKGILLIDQQAAHHNIVNSTPIPHPQSIHRRGARIPGKPVEWLGSIEKIRNHMGLLLARVECAILPREFQHLYPGWAQVPGTSLQWIWTPELRLLDKRVRLVNVQSALTGNIIDTALWEYSDFALGQISKDRHPIIKPVLHAAYGTLGVNRYKEYRQIVIGDKGKYSNVEKVRIPGIEGECNEVTIKGLGIAHVQNVIAYGVITSEQTVRSLILAREYEWDLGINVVQIFADALLIRTSQVPFTPPGWEVKGDLGDVVAGRANEIISTRLQRIPGISGERNRSLYIQQVRNAA